jgi:mRNA interferase RelE/StbE
MDYRVQLKPRALKDLKHIPKDDAIRVLDAIDNLTKGMAGDVKKLTNLSPEYRLRVGKFRVLFEIENEAQVVIYRVVHRREAYR